MLAPRHPGREMTNTKTEPILSMLAPRHLDKPGLRVLDRPQLALGAASFLVGHGFWPGTCVAKAAACGNSTQRKSNENGHLRSFLVIPIARNFAQQISKQFAQTMS